MLDVPASTILIVEDSVSERAYEIPRHPALPLYYSRLLAYASCLINQLISVLSFCLIKNNSVSERERDRRTGVSWVFTLRQLARTRRDSADTDGTHLAAALLPADDFGYATAFYQKNRNFFLFFRCCFVLVFYSRPTGLIADSHNACIIKKYYPLLLQQPGGFQPYSSGAMLSLQYSVERVSVRRYFLRCCPAQQPFPFLRKLRVTLFSPRNKWHWKIAYQS